MNLIDKFIPLFQTIGSVEILLAEDSDKSFLDLEQEMNALLSSVSVSEYSVSQNADAMFAACALIDELILGSQWKCKDEWALLLYKPPRGYQVDGLPRVFKFFK